MKLRICAPRASRHIPLTPYKNLLAILLLALVGCANDAVKPPVDATFAVPPRRIEQHVVNPGDTLFSIAWSYGVDYRQLAATNSLVSPYTLVPGQKLRLSELSGGAASASKREALTGAAPHSTAMDEHAKGAHSAAAQAVRNVRDLSAVSASVKVLDGWVWPATGAIIDRYIVHSSARRGIDIRGKLGEPVYAANSGKVVYAGSGLVGYGNLLIIKHSDQYLSAYAHSSRLLVSEGQSIKAGDLIAEIGDSGTDSVKLYFEIRSDGEPVDPLRILPLR